MLFFIKLDKSNIHRIEIDQNKIHLLDHDPLLEQKYFQLLELGYPVCKCYKVKKAILEQNFYYIPKEIRTFIFNQFLNIFLTNNS